MFFGYSHKKHFFFYICCNRNTLLVKTSTLCLLLRFTLVTRYENISQIFTTLRMLYSLSVDRIDTDNYVSNPTLYRKRSEYKANYFTPEHHTKCTLHPCDSSLNLILEAWRMTEGCIESQLFIALLWGNKLTTWTCVRTPWLVCKFLGFRTGMCKAKLL